MERSDQEQIPLPAIPVPSLNSLLAPVPSSPRDLYSDFVMSSAIPPTAPFTGTSFAAAQPPRPTTRTSTSSSSATMASAARAEGMTPPRRSARLQNQSSAQPTAAAAFAASSAKPARTERSQSRKRKAETQPRRKKPPQRKVSLKPPPNAKDDAKYDEKKPAAAGEEKHAEAEEEKSSCCVCMSVPSAKDLSKINGCSHSFCFDCIAKWADRENTCPLCKARFTKITRVNKTKRRKGSSPNSKSVRSRDQRSDLVSGAALEAMLHSIAATNRNSTNPAGQSTRLRSIFMSSFPMAIRSNQARPSGRRTALFMEENLLESDDESSEDLAASLGLTDFNELMRQTMQNARSRREARQQGAPFAVSAPGLAASAASSPTGPSSANPLAGNPLLSLGHPLIGLFSQPPPAPVQAPPSRSYAVNADDSNAGRAAENPLEIDDSSEDEVEVIE